MQIKSAKFLVSNTDPGACPKPDRPEYVFTGRSNVGKSSLINMITGVSGLAKTSSTPGKTRLINHFIINDDWYLVDLPGYGFAKVDQSSKRDWANMIKGYLLKRKNLMNVFLLVDSRHEPLKNDLDFIEWMALNHIPFSIIFTKTDKLNKSKKDQNINAYKNILLKTWEELPLMFLSSSSTNEGKKEILSCIEEINSMFEIS